MVFSTIAFALLAPHVAVKAIRLPAEYSSFQFFGEGGNVLALRGNTADLLSRNNELIEKNLYNLSEDFIVGKDYIVVINAKDGQNNDYSIVRMDASGGHSDQGLLVGRRPI